MLESTLSKIKCCGCKSKLNLNIIKFITYKNQKDIISGILNCSKCGLDFSIINGVAILVKDTLGYIQSHAKGLSNLVNDEDIPLEYRTDYLDAKKDIMHEHIEDDLESQRVLSLYILNHFFTSKQKFWYKNASQDIQNLIVSYWDKNIFYYISELLKNNKNLDIIELGCNVGGLLHKILKSTKSYIGIDYSFTSIAIARHIYLNAPYNLEFLIPQDLIDGSVSLKTKLPKISTHVECDFIVSDFDNIPFQNNAFDTTIALNTIDMLSTPTHLPKIQTKLTKKGGLMIQSCPYIWHPEVAKFLKNNFKKMSSNEAVIKMYIKLKLKIIKEFKHIPWLFFKHLRQIELYSVHIFAAKKL